MAARAIRFFLIVLWLLLVTVAAYLYFFHRDIVQSQLRSAFSFSAIVGSLLYLVFACIRGFTLIPSTYLVLAALAFFPPLPAPPALGDPRQFSLFLR